MRKKRKKDTGKRKKRFVTIMAVGAVCTAACSVPVYAGWIQSESGRWSYELDDGRLAAGWFQDVDGIWYRMGDDGFMLADQWFWDADGRWYYLSQSGAMLADCVTPDGYTVGADGAWDGGAAIRLSGNTGSGGSGGSGGGGRSRGISSAGGNSSNSGGSSGSGENSGSLETDPSSPGANNGSSLESKDTGSSSGVTDLDTLQTAINTLFSWYDRAIQAESGITGEDAAAIPDGRFLVRNQSELNTRLATIVGQILDLPDTEEKCWEVYVIGKNIVPNGTILKTLFRDNIQYSHLNLDTIEVEDTIYHVSKFIIVRVSDITTEDEERVTEGYWNTGDEITREIDGESYQFTCIDDHYTSLQNTEDLALFLCDSVIPADWGSDYIPRQEENGVYEYEFIAGPIVKFGDNSDYKYSAIRSWLTENDGDFSDAKEVNTGVSYACFGSTEAGMFRQLDDSDLNAEYIGSQKMMDKLFILSLEEALMYRDNLWCFEGETEENPESQIGEFCKGYWLRTPSGTRCGDSCEMVYIVDLINGNLRSECIAPESDDLETMTEQEMKVTTTVGVRPAFVLEQKYLTEYGEEGL